MFSVAGKDTIMVSRGDYALIPLKISGAEDGETVVFSISKVIDPTEIVVERTGVISEGMVYIVLENNDTKDLPAGTYYWDCHLPDFWGEGKRHTPIRPKTFMILGVSHLV